MPKIVPPGAGARRAPAGGRPADARDRPASQRLHPGPGRGERAHPAARSCLLCSSESRICSCSSSPADDERASARCSSTSAVSSFFLARSCWAICRRCLCVSCSAVRQLCPLVFEFLPGRLTVARAASRAPSAGPRRLVLAAETQPLAGPGPLRAKRMRLPAPAAPTAAGPRPRFALGDLLLGVASSCRPASSWASRPWASPASCLLQLFDLLARLFARFSLASQVPELVVELLAVVSQLFFPRLHEDRAALEVGLLAASSWASVSSRWVNWLSSSRMRTAPGSQEFRGALAPRVHGLSQSVSPAVDCRLAKCLFHVVRSAQGNCKEPNDTPRAGPFFPIGHWLGGVKEAGSQSCRPGRHWRLYRLLRMGQGGGSPHNERRLLILGGGSSPSPLPVFLHDASHSPLSGAVSSQADAAPFRRRADHRRRDGRAAGGQCGRSAAVGCW